MACISCYRNANPNDINPPLRRFGRDIIACASCNGTGFAMPPSVTVNVGAFGSAKIEFPECRHCNGKGMCPWVFV